MSKLDIQPETMETSDVLAITNGNDYEAIFQKVTEISMKEIEFQKPLLTFCGNPLIYPKSITQIQGGKGTHKSRFAEMIISAFLNRTNNNLLNMELLQNDYFVILLDTERSITEQLPYAIQKIKLKAGYFITDNIPNFFFTSNIGIKDRQTRLQTFKELISKKRDLYPNKHFIIVIDVLTDLVKSFNNEVESLELIDYLNELINDFNCSVICVIHQNPNSENPKARGHIGTESTNKASCVIQVSIDETTDLIKAKYLHLRSHKKPKEPVIMLYDETAGGLVIPTNEIVSQKNYEKEQAFIEVLIRILSKETFMNQKDLSEKLMKELKLTKTTALRRIDELLNGIYNGYTFKRENKKGGRYYLDNQQENEKDLF